MNFDYDLKKITRENSITIAAVTSSFCSVLFGFPFDSLKTRLQTYKYPSTMVCVKSTYYYEGLRGFYRGVVPLLMTSTIFRAVSWNLYTSWKQSLLSKFERFENKLGYTVLPCSLAGGFTGLSLSVFAAPFEFIKVQRQLDLVETTKIVGRPTKTRNLLQWVSYIINAKGFRGLYTGYSLHAPMEFLACASYFGVYESIKSLGPQTNGKPDSWVSLLGGGISGAFSWFFVFPIDVVKSIEQKNAFRSNSQSIPHIIKDRYNEMGLKGFYRGMSMQMIRSVPVHAINFYVFENILAFCKNI